MRTVPRDSGLDDLLVHEGTTAHPYPVYRRLRDDFPAFFSERLQCWVISRYDDVRIALEDATRFSSADRVRRSDVSAEVWEAFAGFEGFFWSDPPDYIAHREAWANAFKRRLKGIPTIVQRIVDELLADVVVGEPFDAVSGLAFPLPATVVFELLGVPREDQAMFKTVAGVLIAGGPETAPAMHASAKWLQEFLEDCQREPRDDILSDLFAGRTPVAEMDSHALRSEIVDVVHFLLAGHETTASTIASGLLELLRRPADRAAFATEKAARTRAVEEMLRYESPLQFLERRVTHTTVVADAAIAEGALVRLLLGSANHDERRFDHPDEFDARRSPNSHLAFGHGVHLCLGAPLARIEIPIALTTILQRFPNLALACDLDQVPWRRNFMFHAIESLPVSLGQAIRYPPSNPVGRL